MFGATELALEKVGIRSIRQWTRSLDKILLCHQEDHAKYTLNQVNSYFLREFGVIFCWNHNFSEIFVTNQFRYNLHLIGNIREYLKKGANSRSGIIRSVQICFLIKRVKVVCSATKFRFSSFGKFILEGTTEKNVL